MVRAWQHILESLGYTVVACTSSVEALAVFTAAPLAFDLVITNQTIDSALTTLAISADIVNVVLNQAICTASAQCGSTIAFPQLLPGDGLQTPDLARDHRDRNCRV